MSARQASMRNRRQRRLATLSGRRECPLRAAYLIKGRSARTVQVHRPPRCPGSGQCFPAFDDRGVADRRAGFPFSCRQGPPSSAADCACHKLEEPADEARSPWSAESLTWEFVLVRENEKERKPELRVQILHTSPHNLLITRHNQHHPSWAPVGHRSRRSE